MKLQPEETGKMAKVTVRHNRLSRYSALLMILLGLVTLLFLSGFYGSILTAIGLVMYWFYRRQTRLSQGPAPPSAAI